MIPSSISIEPISGQHHRAFHDLNVIWLDRYGLKEEPDLRVLADPKGEVIDKGGFIWVALADSTVIGTAALVKEHEGVYELAKMCVADEWQGKGVSKLLIEACLSKAREVNASKVELFSNSQLLPALKLYERYGFRYIEVTDSPFATADVKMELVMT